MLYFQYPNEHVFIFIKKYKEGLVLMYYMISDFLNTYGTNVSLVAGKGGLSRIVKDVGILDYELDISLRNKLKSAAVGFFCMKSLKSEGISPSDLKTL